MEAAQDPILMSATYENRYKPEPMGPRIALKLERFNDWHALEVRCTECYHLGYITAQTLRRYYSRHLKISDMEHRFRCRSCRTWGSVRWTVVKQKR